MLVDSTVGIPGAMVHIRNIQCVGSGRKQCVWADMCRTGVCWPLPIDPTISSFIHVVNKT